MVFFQNQAEQATELFTPFRHLALELLILIKIIVLRKLFNISRNRITFSLLATPSSISSDPSAELYSTSARDSLTAGLTADQWLVWAKKLKLFEININSIQIWVLSWTMLDNILIFLFFPFEKCCSKIYWLSKLLIYNYTIQLITERCTSVLHDVNRLDTYF